MKKLVMRKSYLTVYTKRQALKCSIMTFICHLFKKNCLERFSKVLNRPNIKRENRFTDYYTLFVKKSFKRGRLIKNPHLV